MNGTTIQIQSTEPGASTAFDCYLSLPAQATKTPAIVLACAIHGVTKEIRDIADAFASAGYIAAAPDLFWRTVPGPLSRDDPRNPGRGQPRLPVLKTGEYDMRDTLSRVQQLPQHNGRAMTMGFCFGGPYAIIGPKRLGYDAGMSCHGTQFKDFIEELDGLNKPVCIIWGDQDYAAPPEVQAAYVAKTANLAHINVHIFPGVLHGFMMRNNEKAWSASTYQFAMDQALGLLKGLGH